VLPSFWRFLNRFWMGAETTDAERSILYLDHDGVGTDVVRLLAWTAVIVVLLALPVSRELSRRRAGATASANTAVQLAGER
jgi:hypothetical protein